MNGPVCQRRVTDVRIDGHSATLHLETLWSRDLTITMGLSARPFASHHFPFGEKPARKETLAGAV
ncbi:MAG: hypothetical protein ACXWYO_01020 [Gaiellaceae bacterium]